MKPGRPKWTTRVSRPALERIHAAIDAGEEPRAIFDRFNVQQYLIAPRAFRRYYDVRRRDWEARQDDAQREPGSDLVESLREALQVELDAGRIKGKQVSAAIFAAVKVRELELKTRADRRAEELFELKVAELRKKQSEALEEVAKQSGLTDEQVLELQKRVIGL